VFNDTNVQSSNSLLHILLTDISYIYDLSL